MTSKSIKLAFSCLFAFVIGGILIVALLQLGDAMAWTTTALGLAVGWATGILAAPYQSEHARFKRIGTAVAGFITGYAVSKVDRLFELWTDPARGPLILEPTFAQRTVLFLTSFLLAAIVTYIGRKYVSFGPGAEQPAGK